MDVIPKAMQSIREEMRHGRGDRLTVPQFRVLAAVNRGITHNKEIGDALGVSEAAISRMIDFLVQDGLIKKTTSKIDRRQSFLCLTIEGAKLYNSIKTKARNRIKNKLDKISSEDQQMAIKGLEILQSNLSILSESQE